MLKCGKAGKSDTSERSWEPDMRRTEGLASAWRLRPHGMLMPYFRWTRLGHAGTRLKGKARTGRILDIMAKESYLLQGTIYSNK